METQENSLENLIKTIQELKAENEQIKQQNQWLMEQFRLLKHKQYGASSEQHSAEQMNLFNEGEATAELSAPEPPLTEVKTHYRKRTRLTTDKLPEDLPVEEIEYELLTPFLHFKLMFYLLQFHWLSSPASRIKSY